MSVTLQQLRFLVALADELSFSRAAERCHVAQPTLSAGLRALETGLGVHLVERSRRHVMMTEVGAEIAERGRALLVGADEIEAVAAAHRRPDAGTLRLGAIPTVGPYLLPRALPALRERFPGLRLYLREELTESLLDGVTEGRLDLALIALPFDVGGLDCTELFEDGYHLATPAGAQGPPALDGARLLLLERGHCLQRHALRAFPEAGLAADESFAATSLGTLTAMVSEGLGITLLPDLAVSGGVASESTVALTPLPEACPRTIAVVWRPTSPRADVFRLIAETLRNARPPRSAVLRKERDS
ncbi:MAG: LysR substrate-binding domain-containing protein [Paracoccaceae bacterium]|jgi:LysR family hydrogen peroxide-inducible transcriptional activator|nr:LysR substrate-binding domain-containing protein [Paracoccaceae bacterium]